MIRSLRSPERAVLAEMLRERRTSLGVRQVDLAALLGVPQSFVSKYEAGERRLDLVELRQICAALEITLSDFVGSYEKRLRAVDRRP